MAPAALSHVAAYFVRRWRLERAAREGLAELAAAGLIVPVGAGQPVYNSTLAVRVGFKNSCRD